MYKFILTAKDRSDIINLLVNTASVDVQKVEWNVNSITRSEEDAHCPSLFDLDDWVEAQDWDKVDDAIMSGDVPTGGMVVVCDEQTNPVWGYVCGNGRSWYKVHLNYELQKKILKMVHPDVLYFVVGTFRSHVFANKTDCGKWLEEGFAACEGSEQMRYASMMNQLDAGKMFLDYDD